MFTFIFSFYIAIIAFVYSEILTEGGMILNGLYKFLEKHLGKYPYIFKPLIDCSKCVAGQIALWVYLFIPEYNLFQHAAVICLSIYLLMLVKGFYLKFIRAWLNS
jgi:hypothetical protein